MKRLFASEFLFQIFSLLISFIVVHTFYLAVVLPNADAVAKANAARIAAGDMTAAPQSVWVVIKDYEQESEVILMFWCLAIMGYKTRGLKAERELLTRSLVQVPEGSLILPDDARDYLRPIEALPAHERARLLQRALMAGLRRFTITRSVQDVAGAIRETCDSEDARLDSELSMLRYILWAIPAIGFIGTVRGIGMALTEAHRAAQGDISGVTDALGVAFNSTLVALLISIFLMFLMHQLQLHQERLVLEANAYCENKLLLHMKVPQEH
jgi:biopolymer transport protein ExbB/TolQ